MPLLSQVPADVRVLKSVNFKVEQSSLTGEPDEISKTVDNTIEHPLEAQNLAFFGTLAVNGKRRRITFPEARQLRRS